MENKIFSVGFRYKETETSKGTLGVRFIEAKDEKEAAIKFGYSDVFAVKEISLDDFLKSGASF